MKMDNVIYLFKDTKVWAFRWNQHHFWTSFPPKMDVNVVAKLVAAMNPEYKVVVS